MNAQRTRSRTLWQTGSRIDRTADRTGGAGRGGVPPRSSRASAGG
ncbi:hypothetical protein [Leucobacter soli]